MATNTTILAIETSCDETALAVVSVIHDENGDAAKNPKFTILAEALHSQIDIHKEFGGVFPAVAKREHALTVVPLLVSLCEKLAAGQHATDDTTNTQHQEFASDLQIAKHAHLNVSDSHTHSSGNNPASIDPLTWDEIEKLLEREPGLFELFRTIVPTLPKPNIDLIAVTKGPGLEPALWVGINFARALSLFWNIPLIGTDHMEGHITSALAKADSQNISFPAIALLVSGGHTELVAVKHWGSYSIIGRTRDDAAGEAFDKAARILGLPYPGGPEISKRAASVRENSDTKHHSITLPRPMINSNDLDFSFSGLKTAVLYATRDFRAAQHLTPTDQLPKSFINECSFEFEEAAVDVLISKTKQAVEDTGAQTIIVGGGVIANTYLRERLEKLATQTGATLALPDHALSTDNAIMIAVAGYFASLRETPTIGADIKANGNLTL